MLGLAESKLCELDAHIPPDEVGTAMEESAAPPKSYQQKVDYVRLMSQRQDAAQLRLAHLQQKTRDLQEELEVATRAAEAVQADLDAAQQEVTDDANWHGQADAGPSVLEAVRPVAENLSALQSALQDPFARFLS